MRAVIGVLFAVLGSFVAALNLATLYPNPWYKATWTKVLVAAALAAFGVLLTLTRKNGP